MPLTLNEIQSLIDALGVRLPDGILDQKAKAEEFEERRQKLATEASTKPADWRLKTEFDGQIARSVEDAGKSLFDAAFKLLDEAGQLLQQPDTPPPPAPEPPPASTPSTAPPGPIVPETPPASEPLPEPAAAQTDASASDQTFRQKWGLAKEAWLGCLETVDRQLEAVKAKMLSCGDLDFKIIADRGLPALTNNHKTPVMQALFELDNNSGAEQKAAAVKAEAAIAAFRKHLHSYHLIRALDEHSRTAFGTPMSLRSELGKGLTALEEALQSITKE